MHPDSGAAEEEVGPRRLMRTNGSEIGSTRKSCFEIASQVDRENAVISCSTPPVGSDADARGQ